MVPERCQLIMGMMECVDPFVLQGGDAGLAIRICSPFSTWLPIYQQTRPCLADPSPSSIPSPPLAPFPFLFPSGPLSFPFFRPLPSLIHILTSALLALLAILLLSPAKLMAEESVSASSRHAGPALQRGKACLRCRKRKMRCDGTKPACQQCQRAKKGDMCEYDDGKGKTRTQILRETIARLESRVRELEDPDRSLTSVQLFDPHALVFSEPESSSSSAAESPSSIPFSTSHSPYGTFEGVSPIPTPPLPWEPSTVSPPWLCCSTTTYSQRFQGSHSPEPFASGISIELAESFLDIFMPHRHQVGLQVHEDRLRNSLHLPLEDQRHPALMNAIFLWACYLSRAQSFGQHEALYLERATEAVRLAIATGSPKVVDVIQGSCLLSLYLLTTGRLVEGGMAASTAASLALQWGLHRQVSEELMSAGFLDSPFTLPPPQDSIERGERILAFWQIYILDRCWSVVLQRPPTISDANDIISAITVPWPQDIEEYEAENFNVLADFSTVQMFLAHQSQVNNFAGGFSSFALRAKASALFERAFRIASMWPAVTNDEETQTFENAIVRFSNSLLPVQQLHGTLPADKHSLIVVHTLVQAAIIRLHYRSGEDDHLRHEKCMRAARTCLFIIRHIGDSDYDFLDPIIGSCWGSAANVLVREITRLEAWSAVSSLELRAQVGTLVAALTKLSVRFPLLGEFVRRLLNVKIETQ
ncbi:uncharacterized protein STEHIDRAFT_124203 [Stereum hirsutum FP-91666 SS1]|uniref:uncharacterized protein n=1 Tax=Stereum hirsutum (strain FP-91666) TaxID=721885 RepID=UPI0004449B75|nr:uncharacterized protein STEHIDRAFT_124203 [Stereum hirsutum FP-91666 SS1]EIM82869.1 hypothetical protein STEHIDRAFT_124203 [Stereum hirsutum FP-91666 SS1]